MSASAAAERVDNGARIGPRMTRITPQLPPSENSRICTRRNERCADLP